MALKGVTLLAVIGMILVTALRLWDLVFNVLNVVQGLVPAMVLFPSLIYAFGALTLAIFLYSFYKTQTR